LKAVIMGAQTVKLGDAKVVIAGGMESMSQAPFYLPAGRLRTGLYGDGDRLCDSILRDGLLDPFTGSHMGHFAEQTAAEYKVGREEQDDYAKRSYSLAKEAWAKGAYNHDEVVPVEGVKEDEEFSKFKPEKMRQLRPAFDKTKGTITAANSSKLNDGASAMLLSSLADGAIAEIVGYAEAEVEPERFSVAPATAIPLALQRAFPQDATWKASLERVSWVEVNEAFSVVALVNKRLLGLPDDGKIVFNGRGGAVSLGHPIGSSGCRILVTLVHALQPGQYGVAAVCNGGGGASAVVIKRL
jgi:acetyl-CoA C-acetyltransferase